MSADTFYITTETTANIAGASSAAGYTSDFGTGGDSTSGMATFNFAGSPNILGLTSAYDSLTTSDSSSTSTSYAASDLATGTVKNSVSTAFYAFSLTNWYDTLTFNIPGATQSTVTELSINYLLDGSFNAASGGNGSVLTDFGFGNQGLEAYWSSYVAPYTFANTGGWSSQNIGCLMTSCFDFQGTIAVTGANPVVPVYLGLILLCAPTPGSTCSEDYGDTGAVSLSLPAGVTYTSASGVFLTQSPIPEPHNFALLAAGLIGITLRKCRVKLFARRLAGTQ